MKLSRRSLIGAGALGVGATALGWPNAWPNPSRRRHGVKNVIFCVVDGMALQALAMADQLRQLEGGEPTYWTQLIGKPHATTGLQSTRSLSSIVTDSAAASSAWGSGRKVWNRMLNEFPDGTKLKTLASIMVEAGVKVGLVTTTSITHATPAGFAVNCHDRDLEGLIAERYLTSGVDVLMGGGNRFFAPDKRPDKKDLYAEFAKAGYTVALNRDQALAWKGGKILGVFSERHLPFAVDRKNSADLTRRVPSLAEMARTAINGLQSSPDGFLLQIEGGRVDHGGHANDLAGLLFDQYEFDEAVKVAVEFALEDGETLVVITADHACGGPSLNGAGTEYFDTTESFKAVSNMKASYESLIPVLGERPDSDKVRATIKDLLGIEMTTEDADLASGIFKGQNPFKAGQFFKGTTQALAALLGNYTKVTWTSGNHTSEHVLLTAVGPGSDFAVGLHENATLFDVMLDAKEIQYQNPVMDFESAKKFYDKMKTGADPELQALYGAHEECACHG
ncbi:MAG: alkaline phosphatase [Fimbriimonadaceae bacterium]|nr:alkaline phosphatase [Fimbriimonadaceae bacterium]QYK57997.1 MAG: alkaline phosphatase [Fimbriimonadaceae bacterium]